MTSGTVPFKEGTVPCLQPQGGFLREQEGFCALQKQPGENTVCGACMFDEEETCDDEIENRVGGDGGKWRGGVKTGRWKPGVRTFNTQGSIKYLTCWASQYLSPSLVSLTGRTSLNTVLWDHLHVLTHCRLLPRRQAKAAVM